MLGVVFGTAKPCPLMGKQFISLWVGLAAAWVGQDVLK
jgi:hypothetical protein